MGLVENKIRDIRIDKYISDIRDLNPTKEELDKTLKLAVPKIIDRMKMDFYHPFNSITKPSWKL